MARFYPSGGGGGASGSDDCTATAGDLLKDTTAILSGSDDEPVQGTLELTGDAQTGDVLKNKGFYNVNAKIKSIGTLELTGNMTAGDLLAGKTGYATDPKTKINGSMVDRGTVNHSLPINGTYTIPGGKHSGSGKVTQRIPTQGALTLNPGKTAKTGSVSGKYMTGNITVPAVSIAANLIKKGSRITFPDGSYVVGTFEGYVASPTDLYYYGNNAGNFKLNGHFTAESGMLHVQYNYDNYAEMATQKQYNLAGFTKINILLKCTNASNKKIRFGYGDSSGGAVGTLIGYATISDSESLQTKTVSFNNLNVTKYIWVEFEGYFTADIYRIWIS